MTNLKKVPFKSLCLGARFKYEPGCNKVWTRVAHNTVAEWDAQRAADAWVGQSLCLGVDSDSDLAKEVWLIVEGEAGLNIEAAAQKLADLFDYPWEHMPEKGRSSMREHAKAVILAAGGAA